MELLHERCAGLDVHQKTVVARVRVARGRAAQREVRSFATTTGALRELAAWLVAAQVEAVAQFAQRHGQPAQALERPLQRAHRIALGGRFHQAAQVLPERRVLVLKRFASAAGPSAATRLQRLGLAQFAHPARHRFAGQACRPHHGRLAAGANRRGFAAGEQAPCRSLRCGAICA